MSTTKASDSLVAPKNGANQFVGPPAPYTLQWDPISDAGYVYENGLSSVSTQNMASAFMPDSGYSHQYGSSGFRTWEYDQNHLKDIGLVAGVSGVALGLGVATGYGVAAIAPTIAGAYWTGNAYIATKITLATGAGGLILRTISGAEFYKYPTKPNFGGIEQPYNPINGRWMSYSVNVRDQMTVYAEFGVGMGQGAVSAFTGADKPIARTTSQAAGQAVGETVGIAINRLFQ